MNIMFTKEMPKGIAEGYPEGCELIKIGRMAVGMAVREEPHSRFTIFTGFSNTPWMSCLTDNLEGAIKCRIKDLFEYVDKIKNEIQMEE